MAYSDTTNAGSYYKTLLYTGDGTAIGSGGQAVTGVGFQPDLNVIKERNGVDSMGWQDSTRGSQYSMFTDSNAAQVNSTEYVNTFTADGFTLGDAGWVNQSSQTYVAWNWKVNGGTTSSNTDGTITTTVQADQTRGISIVKYTANGTDGATIGHGLGVKPDVIAIKSMDNSTGWMNYHSSNVSPDFSASMEMYWASNAGYTSATTWNSTEPTSTVITLDNSAGNGVNVSGDYIAYCWVGKPGFSKFSYYKGTGNSTQGPFVYTGFKPAYLMIKRYSGGSGSWEVFDNKRDGINLKNNTLYYQTAGTEQGTGDRSNYVTLLSNGFHLSGTDGNWNANGDGYIYYAWAAEPLVSNVGSSGIPATAV